MDQFGTGIATTRTGSMIPPMATSTTLVPAGFWIRFGASFVDGLIIGVVRAALSIGAGLLTVSLHDNSNAVIAIKALDFALGMAITVVYFGHFYSTRGASPGKMLFGLKVLNETDGAYIGYGKTFVREIFGKFVSAIILGIGYIMAGARSDKKALHDMIAGTRVYREVSR